MFIRPVLRFCNLERYFFILELKFLRKQLSIIAEAGSSIT